MDWSCAFVNFILLSSMNERKRESSVLSTAIITIHMDRTGEEHRNSQRWWIGANIMCIEYWPLRLPVKQSFNAQYCRWHGVKNGQWMDWTSRDRRSFYEVQKMNDSSCNNNKKQTHRDSACKKVTTLLWPRMDDRQCNFLSPGLVWLGDSEQSDDDMMVIGDL